MTPEVWETLGALYKEEFLCIKSVEVLDKKKFKLTCNFPEYGFSIEKPTHVSNVQMQLAFTQAAFCAIGLAIRNLGAESPISFEYFYENRMHATYDRQSELRYKHMLKPQKDYYLIVEVKDITVRMGRAIAYLEFHKTPETFMGFEATCSLSEQPKTPGVSVEDRTNLSSAQ